MFSASEQLPLTEFSNYRTLISYCDVMLVTKTRMSRKNNHDPYKKKSKPHKTKQNKTMACW